MAGGEKRKNPRGEDSGLRVKEVPTATQHSDIAEYTSSSQASGKAPRSTNREHSPHRDRSQVTAPAAKERKEGEPPKGRWKCLVHVESKIGS